MSQDKPNRQFSSLYRLICSTCGKEVGAVIPKDGDGTAYVSRKHKANGVRCPDWQTYENYPIIEAFRR
ncbi:hypothetical protein GCM10027577_47540 [Spirosoma fluminis]